MYLIKHIPEDFLVTERSSVKLQDTGPYLYYKLVKKNWNTLDAVKRIAESLHLPEKQIGFAGSKDRNAVTEQLISVYGTTKEKVDAVKLNGIELHFAGRGDVPLSLGDLNGNSFEIVIRNLEVFPLPTINYIPNYFDEQRFGSHNVSIGKHLIKKDFETAVKSINDPHYQEYLQQHTHDYVGALKLLPIRLLRMYLNAYQSYLWNETLAMYLKDHGRISQEVPYSLGTFIFVQDEKEFIPLQIPLIGFGSGQREHGEVQDIISYLLKREQLTYDDFIIKQIPALTLEGELRLAFVEVQQLQISKLEDDEFHPGKKKVLVSFSLGKGSYATIVLKILFA